MARDLAIHGLVMTRSALVLDDARASPAVHRQHLGWRGRGQCRCSARRSPAHGQLNGLDATFEILGDSLSTARRGRPYRFRLDERSDGARLTAAVFSSSLSTSD